MPSCSPPSSSFDPERVSPSILDAMTREIDQRDQFRTENWEGCKRIFDAAFLGGPPIFRRACRGFLKGRYERAVLALPGTALCVASLPISLATAMTIGLLNKARQKPRSIEALWEHRFCVSVDYHLATIWGETREAIDIERKFKAWVQSEISQMPERIRCSEKVWWRMRKWSREISMREKMALRY